MALDLATGVNVIQTGLLCGIFWRMGGFQAALQNITHRVTKLERILNA